MLTNKSKKQDLRISRTQKSLVAAMLALLEKQGFQKVTVNELCDMSMVSRTTFYQHFEDKYHLLRFSLEQVRERLLEAVDEGDMEQLIVKMLDLIEEKEKSFRSLLLEDMNYELLRMLSELSVREVNQKLETRALEGCSFPVPIPILSIYISGGMAQLLLFWINSGFSVPKEDMARHLLALILADGTGIPRMK